MTIHVLKSWSYLFNAHKKGIRHHDLRINDRNFKVGDVVELQEYDQAEGEFTGEMVRAKITYITGHDGTPCAVSSAVLDPRYVILGYKYLDVE